ncbi:substrate-binding domain-containing protein [Megalodesulfovibrio gigas]|uniref:Putative von Willebrand factor A n=1 Tax=Megalodesulfovibrio gigas (strain ATCC 19364 / DSM 1382 / NCIMB 9332 / VKM B-1759) TaxID=1121448 RepID=T2G788_MEGG1|nr:substrate-binding domain-containing protein [Megalodesulfovibrio gigas]AGW12465.1 putative von Willebrand factor A [Megalodesulfovibrio gigas DSM 1382 = ATCC 19364]
MRHALLSPLLTFLLLAGLTGGCSNQAAPLESLTILACPEVKRIEPVIMQAAQAQHLDIQVWYKTPVDILLDLQSPGFPCDAVLTGNTPWLALGDTARRVREGASIMHSPVALGLRRSLAESLGWTGREVHMAELLGAIRAGTFTIAMASATQSSSGAAAYMGMLFALAGRPEMLTPQHLQDPALQDQVRQLLAGVSRTAGGSQLLSDLFLGSPSPPQAIINDELQLLAINQALTAQGGEPLHIVYFADGLAVADFTLGFVEKPDNKHKLERFIELRNRLLEPDSQQALAAAGGRTSLLGMNPKLADATLFRSEWGVDLARSLAFIRWPAPDTLRDALTLYQTTLRKPSCTVYLLDARASSLQQRKDALAAMLDPIRAERVMLQPSAGDITIILPFGHPTETTPWIVHGNDPQSLLALQQRLDSLNAMETPDQTGDTASADLAPPLRNALELLRDADGARLPAVILLTGGNIRLEEPLPEIQRRAWDNSPLPPVYVVITGTGDAEPNQFTALGTLTTQTGGRLLDGRLLGPTAALRLATAGN